METDTLGQLCDICGDTGYAKAILTCSICHKSREHIYCMKLNMDYVPHSWHCEPCQHQKMGYDGPRRYNDEVAQKLSERKKILSMRNASSKVLDVSQCVGSSSDKLAVHLSTRNIVLHKVETRKSKFLPVEDVCAMSSVGKPKHSTSQRCSSSPVGFSGSNYCYIPKMTSLAVEPDKHHSNEFARCPKPLPFGSVLFSTSEKPATKLSQPLHEWNSLYDLPCKSLESENVNSVMAAKMDYKRHTSGRAYHSPLNHIGPSIYGVEDKSGFESILSGKDQHADKFDSVLYANNVLREEPDHAALYFSEDGASKEISLPKSGEENVPKTPEVSYMEPVLLDVQEELHLENTISILDKHAGKADLFLFKDVHTEETLDAAAHFDKNETSTSKTSFKFWEGDIVNPPAVRSSWKGSFEILNNHPGLYDNLQAYPHGRVSGKAYLVSKQMPRVLQFTLRPHHDVWPNNFHTDSLFDLDIALYFLPIDFCRSKEKYSGLVELMEKEDLSLQSCLNGVDLLIFTSRRLPFEGQGMNKQVYLWGLFLSSTGWHSSVGLREKQHTVDLPLSNYGISENSVSVRNFDDEVADMEIDMVGGKEVEGINRRSLGSNSMGACTSSLNTTSQGVYPVYKSTTATHLRKVKREHCDDIDASPGLFRVYSNHPLREATVSNHIDQVREDYCDDFYAPRISKPVTSTATFLGPIFMSHVQMPPSGFSELLKLNQWDSSSKQSPSISNTNLVATSILPYQLLLPSDRLNPLPLVSDVHDGGRRINVASRVLHHKVNKFKTRFTQEQKDKMLMFAEKVGWSIRKQEDAAVQKFCQEVGVGRRSLKVWMYNKKHDLKIHSSGGGTIRAPHYPVKKRFKSKFTQEQKDKMWGFAEKVGWLLTNQEEAVVQQFCQEVGISSRVLKCWMGNNKQNLKMKLSSASTTGTL